MGWQLPERALITTTCRPTPAGPIASSITTPGWKAARSFHPGGVNVLYCDGHVVFAKDTVNLGIWQAISTRAGGEIVSSDAF